MSYFFLTPCISEAENLIFWSRKFQVKSSNLLQFWKYFLIACMNFCVYVTKIHTCWGEFILAEVSWKLTDLWVHCCTTIMQSLQIYVNYGTDETELLLVRLTCVLAVLDQKKKKNQLSFKAGENFKHFCQYSLTGNGKFVGNGEQCTSVGIIYCSLFRCSPHMHATIQR